MATSSTHLQKIVGQIKFYMLLALYCWKYNTCNNQDRKTEKKMRLVSVMALSIKETSHREERRSSSQRAWNRVGTMFNIQN